MSTNTGFKLLFITATISEIHVNDGTIISPLVLSFLKIFSARILNKLAEDPELTNILYFTPSHLLHFFSNSKIFLD